MFKMTVRFNVDPDHCNDFQFPNCINVDPNVLYLGLHYALSYALSKHYYYYYYYY